ncbi:hypothetical protein RF11_04571 [Thelohanellus kitauei]|uniref:Uncharacterized protein n=1 Tax=Thelohanellus kitauei TaxID=669202 RepID=A0A0C2J489_THEKT|nr:hypothetical protein RF11_04571 [Thelohanellus kitauei]
MNDNSMKIDHKYIFKNEWEKTYPIRAVKYDQHSFYCLPCGTKITCAYNGIRSVKKHCETLKHSQSLKREQNIVSQSVMVHPNQVPVGKHSLNSSFSESRKKGYLAEKRSHKAKAMKNLDEMSKLSKIPKNELKSSSNNDDLNMMKLLEICKNKYGVKVDVEMNNDHDLETGQNYKTIVQDIKEELLFLQFVLKQLRSYIQ